jgi:hypothetical protein
VFLALSANPKVALSDPSSQGQIGISGLKHGTQIRNKYAIDETQRLTGRPTANKIAGPADLHDTYRQAMDTRPVKTAQSGEGDR